LRRPSYPFIPNGNWACRCLDIDRKARAIWPVIDNFERALKFTRDKTADAKLDRLEALISHALRSAAGRRPVRRFDLVPSEACYGALAA
jgi:hypothetical protein